MRPPAPDAKKTAVKHLPTTGCRCGGLWHTAIVVSENKRECCNHLMPIIGIEGDSPDSISQYHSINTDNPRFQQIMYNKGPVDKSKNSAGTHRGPSRIINWEIAKDGRKMTFFHPLKI